MTRLGMLRRQRAHIEASIVREQTLTDARLVKAAADLYGVTVAEVMAPGRRRAVVQARQAACWLLRARGLSLPQIGRKIGRDHTTVLHAVRKIDADRATCARLYALLKVAA